MEPGAHGEWTHVKTNKAKTERRPRFRSSLRSRQVVQTPAGRPRRVVCRRGSWAQSLGSASGEAGGEVPRPSGGNKGGPASTGLLALLSFISVQL